MYCHNDVVVCSMLYMYYMNCANNKFWIKLEIAWNICSNKIWCCQTLLCAYHVLQTAKAKSNRTFWQFNFYTFSVISFLRWDGLICLLVQLFILTYICYFTRCSDGAKQTGLYIACHSLVQQMAMDSEIDVPETVRLIRNDQPMFISSSVSTLTYISHSQLFFMLEWLVLSAWSKLVN